MPEQSIPHAFEAFEEAAAYVNASLTRSQAITEARDVCWALRDDYLRSELRARRVWLRPVEGQEADEFFYGDFESGWIEVTHRPLSEEQRRHLVHMWRVDPKGGG